MATSDRMKVWAVCRPACTGRDWKTLTGSCLTDEKEGITTLGVKRYLLMGTQEVEVTLWVAKRIYSAQALNLLSMSLAPGREPPRC
jgi:hypothetical protein